MENASLYELQMGMMFLMLTDFERMFEIENLTSMKYVSPFETPLKTLTAKVLSILRMILIGSMNRSGMVTASASEIDLDSLTQWVSTIDSERAFEKPSAILSVKAFE